MIKNFIGERNAYWSVGGTANEIILEIEDIDTGAYARRLLTLGDALLFIEHMADRMSSLHKIPTHTLVTSVWRVEAENGEIVLHMLDDLMATKTWAAVKFDNATALAIIAAVAERGRVLVRQQKFAGIAQR